MANETKVLSTLLMDRGEPLGNSTDSFNRRALHTRLGNTSAEPIPIGGLLSGVSWDWFAVSYPTATQEIYTFKTGGSGGTLVATIELNYTDSSKESLASGGRV